MEAPSMPPPPIGTPSGGEPTGPIDTPDSKKRTRQPRNSACAACAGLKMKCVRNVEGGNCERCTRMGVQCLPAVPKPRKRREGESIDFQSSAALPVDDGLATPARNSSTLQPSSPASRHILTPHSTNVPVDTLLSRADLYHTGSKSFTTLLARGLDLETRQAQTSELLRGFDSNALVNACTVFRQYSAYFPFISIPLRIDPVTMAAQRPMTALALYTVTAAADGDRQSRSSHAFRLALAAKAVVSEERSVDILAGLLIYLAWNHHYMTRPQVYQHLHMLAGMTADLGLYDNPPRADVKDPTVAAELDRCFVGAYLLCSLLPPFAFNKHSPMRWTNNLRTCADNISQVGELQSDRSLASLLELAAALDDMQTALQASYSIQTSRQHLELQAKTAGQRLRALKRDHATLANNPALSACLVDVQYKQIHATDNPDPSIMIQCACSAKEYFDDLLSKPPSFMHQMAIVDWTLVLHMAVIMFRLSKQAASATGWEHGALTSMLQPEQTMDRLLSHMASAPTSDALAPKHDGLLHWLHQFARNAKSILLVNESSGAGRQMDASDGRFRPMNSDAVPLSSRALPYQAKDPSANVHRHGVLDSDFWTRMAHGG